MLSYCRIVNHMLEPDPTWSGDHPDPATSSAPYRVYNIGNHNPLQLMDFVACIERELDRTAKKNFLPLQPGDVPATYADVSDLNCAVGFPPSTPIEEGVKRFVEWYRNYYQV